MVKCPREQQAKQPERNRLAASAAGKDGGSVLKVVAVQDRNNLAMMTGSGVRELRAGRESPASGRPRALDGRRARNNFARPLFLTSIAFAVAPAFTLAQFWSDPVPQTRISSSEQTIKNEIENARYRLGPVRIFPKLSVADAGYNSNVFGTSEDEVGDWEATATAGARLLLPVGRKVYFQANVLPQYNWYASEKDIRNFGGAYGGTAFAFFNRLSIEASGLYTDFSVTPTSETASRSIQRQTSGAGMFAVGITRAVSLLGGGGARRTRYDSLEGSPIPTASLTEQDRTDSSLFAGVRHSLLGPLVVTLIATNARAEFVNKASQRDNETRSYMANVLVSSTQRIFLNTTVGYRQGRSLNGSDLPRFNSPIASAFVSWFPSSFLELQAWGYYRNLSYSLDPNYPLFYESQYGGGPVIRFGPRIRVQLHGSSGRNDYSVASPAEAPPPQASNRRTSYGGSVSVLFSRVVVLNVGAAADRYRSPVPDQNRKVVRLLTGISFEGFPTP